MSKELSHYGVLGMRWGKSGKRGRSKLGYTPKGNDGPSKISDPLLQKIADQRYERQKAGKFFSHSPQESLLKFVRNQPKKSQTNLSVLLNANVMDVVRAKATLDAEKAAAGAATRKKENDALIKDVEKFLKKEQADKIMSLRLEDLKG